VEDWKSGTFRAVYTVGFAAGIFVLHVFQKKSKRGSATPRADMDLIWQRLRSAEQIVKELTS
jgi:phage-related protein